MQGEKMKYIAKYLSLGWLCIAVALEYGSTLGGDASILWGWTLLIWTAPFSILFKFYLYDSALNHLSRPETQIAGAVFEVVCAYFFWFVLFPKIWPKGKES
jgi:hypothetical protein